LVEAWLLGRRTASMRMSGRVTAEAVFVVASVLVGCQAWGAAADRQQPAETPAKGETGALPAPRTQLRYIPPDRGAPEVRVSGGTRGNMNNGLHIDVLAPSETGLTVQEQPTLYWYSSGPIGVDTRISIVVDDSNKTVLNTAIRGPAAEGIHAFPLRGTPIRLALNADYQWSVTVELSRTEPSRNIVASGMIRRVAYPGLPTPTSPRASAEASAEYARLGLWYDALDAISTSVQDAPRDGDLRLLRGELLQQVGLVSAAASDRFPVH
jgi:hypothetical protein